MNGKPLIEQPVEHRKAVLQQLLTPPPKSVLYVGHFEPDEGRRIFEHAKGLKLEGLVAKKLGSIYSPGQRTADWTKVKRKGSVPPERFLR